MKIPKVSCIIPAHNEEPRIREVLKAAHQHPLIDEIIVIDDGSKDQTANVVKDFLDIKLITHQTNLGKSAAVHSGLKLAEGEIILLLDADLVGLNSKNISDLLEPVVSGKSRKSISLRANSPWFSRLFGLDFISGERVFHKNLVDDELDKILKLKGFGLEVFLNRLIVQRKNKISVVRWDNVESPYPHKKRGFFRGMSAFIGMIRDILKTVSPFEVVAQYMNMYFLIDRYPTYAGKDNDTKLSFSIPAHNEENYIGDCLRSIEREMEDGRYDIEVIVVNNASTDKTAEIAKSFSFVRVVDEPKKGLLFARQAGFLASSGDIIANIDADTKLPKGWIKKVFKEFSKNKKLAGLSGPYIYHDLSWVTNAMVHVYYFIGYSLHLINHHILGIGAMLQGGNFILRRSDLEKVNGFNLDIDFYGEDTDIARRIQKVGRVKFTFRLPMYTSGRRLKEEGLVVSAFRYGANHFSTIFLKKPITKKYSDIREKK